MPRLTMVKLAQARELARNGVDYSPKDGALCPWCGNTAKIYKTKRWDGDIRIRYHRCQHHGCVLATMGLTIKSVEVDLLQKKISTSK